MSGRFNGFSQDEIHNIHRGVDGRPIKKAKARVLGAKAANGHGNDVHQMKSVEKPVKPVINDPVKTDDDGVLEDTVSSLHEALYFKPLPSDQRQFDEIDLNGNEPTSAASTDDIQTSNGQHSNPSTARSIYQGISLKDFDAHRQMIEESNKEKKQILARALDER